MSVRLAIALAEVHAAADAFEAALHHAIEVCDSIAPPARRCAWCGALRPFPEDFQKCGGGRHRPECKGCSNEAAKLRREGLRAQGLARARHRKRRALLAAADFDEHTAEDLAESWADRGLWSCVYCGGEAEHADHFVPLALGGTHSIGNLVPACADCNTRKGALDPWTFLEAEGLLDGYRARHQWDDVPEPPPLPPVDPF